MAKKKVVDKIEETLDKVEKVAGVVSEASKILSETVAKVNALGEKLIKD